MDREDVEDRIEDVEDRIEDVDDDMENSVDKKEIEDDGLEGLSGIDDDMEKPVDKSVHKDEMKGDLISGLDKIDTKIFDSKPNLNDSMIVQIAQGEKRGNLGDITVSEFPMNFHKAVNPREFMEKNLQKLKNVEKQQFELIRKQSFIQLYGEAEFKKNGKEFTDAEFGKLAKKWLNEEPFKSVLDTMIKENTDKELLALIDKRKIPEEFARIQEGRPKQMNKGGKPEKEKAPKLSGSKLNGPKSGGPQ